MSGAVWGGHRGAPNRVCTFVIRRRHVPSHDDAGLLNRRKVAYFSLVASEREWRREKYSELGVGSPDVMSMWQTDVHYRGLMHTIAGVPNPLIVLMRPQPGKRAFRPRLQSCTVLALIPCVIATLHTHSASALGVALDEIFWGKGCGQECSDSGLTN